MIDILVTTAAAFPYPKICVESLLKTLPGKGFRILIHDKPPSKLDGTRDYLLSVKDERIRLYLTEKNISHANSLLFLVGKSDADWIISCDSDMEFFDGWADILLKTIADNPKAKVISEVRADQGLGQACVGGKMLRRIWMPRVGSWFCVADRKWMVENDVTFSRGDFYAKHIYKEVFGVELPKFFDRNMEFRFSGDIGWMLFWTSLAQECFLPIPKELKEKYTHHLHKACDFMARNKISTMETGEREDEALTYVH